MENFKTLGLLLTAIILAVYARDLERSMLKEIHRECQLLLENNSSVLKELVPDPSRNLSKCPEPYLCLAEKALKKNEKVKHFTSNLTRRLHAYNKATKCELEWDSSIHLSELLNNIITCSPA